MLMSSSIVFPPALTFVWILHLVYSMTYAFPADSLYNLFDLSQIDPSSVNTDPDSLAFWNEGDDLQSQSNDFFIGATETELSSSTLDSSSFDLFDSDLLVANDPFQASDSNCHASGQASDGIVQDSFEAQLNRIQHSSDPTFGDILIEGSHVCAAGKIPACCVKDNQEEVMQGSRRLRESCFWWGMYILGMKIDYGACMNRNRYCCSSFEGENSLTGVDCDLIYTKEKLRQPADQSAC